MLTATLTNSVGIILLFVLFRVDGKNYFCLFKINKAAFKKAGLIFLGITILTIPIAFAPGYFLSILLWNDFNVPTKMMFGAIEKGLVYLLLIAFHATIAFTELATFFGYIIPKLKKQLKIIWLAVFLPVLFLSVQHCTLPFIADINFIIYRAFAFLPFASLIGFSIYYRPSLFIYFAFLYAILDFGMVLIFLMEK